MGDMTHFGDLVGQEGVAGVRVLHPGGYLRGHAAR